MRIIALALLSFLIFLIEFAKQVCEAALEFCENICHSFVYCLVKYHKRVQLWSDKGRGMITIIDPDTNEEKDLEDDI